MQINNENSRKLITGRALSTDFMEMLINGVYSPLVKLAHTNKDLHFEFKGNLDLDTPDAYRPKDEAIIILYKGNGVLKLHRDGKFTINKAFTKGVEGLPRLLDNEANVMKFIGLVPNILFNIASHGKPSMEIEYEQMLIRANNLEERNNSEYIILANQYKIGQDRWDLVAVKWPRRHRGGKSSKGQLVLIEVKYALNKDIQDAGRQLARYYDYISRNLNLLSREMELILRQKLTLGLIKRTSGQIAALRKLKISCNIEDIEMVLYLIDYNPNSVLKKRMIISANELPFHDQIRVAYGGLAMWEQSSAPLGNTAGF